MEGFQIHLGGGLTMAPGQAAGFGRKLRGLKTTAEELPAYVERVTRRYLAGRSEGESFAQWVVARRRGGAAMSEPPRGALYCPYCGGEDLRPQTRPARRLGVPRVHPGVHGEVHRIGW